MILTIVDILLIMIVDILLIMKAFIIIWVFLRLLEKVEEVYLPKK